MELTSGFALAAPLALLAGNASRPGAVQRASASASASSSPGQIGFPKEPEGSAEIEKEASWIGQGH